MYDVIVIGGGPAGMMAAGRAGQLGQSVLLLEKNKELGVKLLMTGKDRCNVTHFSEDKNELIEAYGKDGKFLYSAFARFGNREVMDFFENRGVKLKVERGNRVFPVSDKSSDIRQALLAFLAQGGVKIKTKATVVGIESSKASKVEASKAGVNEAGLIKPYFAKAMRDKLHDSGVLSPASDERDKLNNKTSDNNKIISQIILSSGERFKAKKYIITTGGLSYPSTGCTGDGYKWAEELGHGIIKPRPALSPIVLKDWFVKRLEGLSLRNIELNIYKNNKKIASKFGEMLFTKNGISGPVVLDLSKKVGELLASKAGPLERAKQAKGPAFSERFNKEVWPLKTSTVNKPHFAKVTRDKLKITGDQFYNTKSNQKLDTSIVLKLDLKPALDFKKLDQRIQSDFQQGNNKQFKNILDRLLPKKLIPVVIKLSKINPDKQVNLITREERKQIERLLKEFTLHPERLVGFGKAIITTGGVDLKEVNSQTMQSRLVNNLYFAGEVLNLDGPTGGYNLQIAWSTGYIAGDK